MSKLDQRHYSAPDFIIKVLSESTASVDSGLKFGDYAAHWVGEYWLIDPETEIVELYDLQDQVYELVLKAQTGQTLSCVVPHFAIGIRAVFDEAFRQPYNKF